jgi:hypothetical protein
MKLSIHPDGSSAMLPVILLLALMIAFVATDRVDHR